MACTIKNTGVAEQRDVFKDIMAKAEVKKAQGLLQGVLDGSVSVNDLMAQQKATGKKNLITKTVVGKDTNQVEIPDNYVEVSQVWVMQTGANFYGRKNPGKVDGWSIAKNEGDITVVYVTKAGQPAGYKYKKVKVEYKIEDTAERKDLQTSTEDLQKAAAIFKGIQSGDTSAALKLFEDKIKEYKDNFNGVYDGTTSIIEKIKKDANIPASPKDSIVIIDKVKKHSGSNSITLDKPISVTKVSARKAGTNFFFNVVQYKFIQETGIVLCDNLYEEYKVEYKGEGSATSKAAAAGALTGKFPSISDVVGDVTSAISDAVSGGGSIGGIAGKALGAVGNIGREVNQVAGLFGKDIGGLIGAASSGDLINQALAAAQNAPATYTEEVTVRDKATNAISLPELAGGEAGIIEVWTKREGNNFFSKMFKGVKTGWRLEGTDLYTYEVRAEIKVIYKKEVEPPASSSVPPADLTNGPPLNPCFDLPPIGVKIAKELKYDPALGKRVEVPIKFKEPKPQPKKLPVTKAEPAPTLAESATVADSTKAPTAAAATRLGASPTATYATLDELVAFNKELTQIVQEHIALAMNKERKLYEAGATDPAKQALIKPIVKKISAKKGKISQVLSGELDVGATEEQLDILRAHTRWKIFNQKGDYSRKLFYEYVAQLKVAYSGYYENLVYKNDPGQLQSRYPGGTIAYLDLKIEQQYFSAPYYFRNKQGVQYTTADYTQSLAFIDGSNSNSDGRYTWSRLHDACKAKKDLLTGYVNATGDPPGDTIA